MSRAIVVFHDHGIHWASPVLKTGFRHCFIVMEVGAYWVSIDPRAGLPEIDVVATASYDLATFYRSHGFATVETERAASPPFRFMPWSLANCVGVVKAILGLRAPLVVTPHMLYRTLT